MMNIFKKTLLILMAALTIGSVAKAQGSNCGLYANVQQLSLDTPTATIGTVSKIGTVTMRGSGKGPFDWQQGYTGSGNIYPPTPTDATYNFASAGVSGNFVEVAKLDSLVGGTSPSTSLMAIPGGTLSPGVPLNGYIGAKYYVSAGQAYVSFIYYTWYLEGRSLPHKFAFMKMTIGTQAVNAGPIYLELARTSNVYTVSWSYDNVTWSSLGSASSMDTTDPTQLGLEVDSGDNTNLSIASYEQVTINGVYPYSQQNGSGLNDVDSKPFVALSGSAWSANNLSESFTIHALATPAAVLTGCTTQQAQVVEAQLHSILYFAVAVGGDVFDTVTGLNVPGCQPSQCYVTNVQGPTVLDGQTASAAATIPFGDSLPPNHVYGTNIAYTVEFFDSNHAMVWAASAPYPKPEPGDPKCSIQNMTCEPFYLEFATTMSVQTGPWIGSFPNYARPVAPYCTPATTPPDHHPLFEYSQWESTNNYFFGGAVVFRFSTSDPWIDTPGFWIAASPTALWVCTKTYPF